MKIQNIAIGASLLSILIAAPSFAQVRVGVDNNIRQTHGTSWSNQDLKIDETTKFNSTTEVDGTTQTIKLEAFGERAAVNLKFDGSTFTGGATASNITPVDPVVIGLFSVYNEKYTATTDKESKVTGTVKSGEFGYFNEITIDAGSYLK
jgi:hypothetical protein